MKKSIGTTHAAVLSAMAGGAVGFALGLLLAPQRGQKARRRLAYQLETLADQTSRLVQGLFGPDATSDARRTSDALVADAQARADHIRNDIETLLNEIRTQESASRSS
jgi:gas vesicle protein